MHSGYLQAPFASRTYYVYLYYLPQDYCCREPINARRGLKFNSANLNWPFIVSGSMSSASDWIPILLNLRSYPVTFDKLTLWMRLFVSGIGDLSDGICRVL